LSEIITDFQSDTTQNINLLQRRMSNMEKLIEKLYTSIEKPKLFLCTENIPQVKGHRKTDTWTKILEYIKVFSLTRM